jgi:hypothetical protein
MTAPAPAAAADFTTVRRSIIFSFTGLAPVSIAIALPVPGS